MTRPVLQMGLAWVCGTFVLKYTSTSSDQAIKGCLFRLSNNLLLPGLTDRQSTIPSSITNKRCCISRPSRSAVLPSSSFPRIVPTNLHFPPPPPPKLQPTPPHPAPAHHAIPLSPDHPCLSNDSPPPPSSHHNFIHHGRRRHRLPQGEGLPCGVSSRGDRPEFYDVMHLLTMQPQKGPVPTARGREGGDVYSAAGDGKVCLLSWGGCEGD